jgi:hypothetical protein
MIIAGGVLTHFFARWCVKMHPTAESDFERFMVGLSTEDFAWNIELSDL